jgi:hypothetical protein
MTINWLAINRVTDFRFEEHYKKFRQYLKNHLVGEYIHNLVWRHIFCFGVTDGERAKIEKILIIGGWDKERGTR